MLWVYLFSIVLQSDQKWIMWAARSDLYLCISEEWANVIKFYTLVPLWSVGKYDQIFSRLAPTKNLSDLQTHSTF